MWSRPQFEGPAARWGELGWHGPTCLHTGAGGQARARRSPALGQPTVASTQFRSSSRRSLNSSISKSSNVSATRSMSGTVQSTFTGSPSRTVPRRTVRADVLRWKHHHCPCARRLRSSVGFMALVRISARSAGRRTHRPVLRVLIDRGMTAGRAHRRRHQCSRASGTARDNISPDR
jgi:hypothetical protein